MTRLHPPMRLMVALALTGGEALSASQILERIAPLYAGEGQCAAPVVETHLQALKSVGIVRVAAAAIVQDRLVASYRLTAHGRRRLAASGAAFPD